MRDHTSLLAWQEARAVVMAVVELNRAEWKPWIRTMFEQLQRASLSVQLNIVEGYGLGGASFRHHLKIAYGSSLESGEILMLLSESYLKDSALVTEALQHCRQCQRLLLGLMRRLGGLRT
ncbi:MAG: four helix bundle protein [Gemmatimonadales bacterium]